MNRKDRRLEQRIESRRRSRARREERPKTAPMMVGAEIVMRPLEQLFDELDRTGKVSVNARGHPDFLARDGYRYEAAPAIEGGTLKCGRRDTESNCPSSPCGICTWPCTTSFLCRNGPSKLCATRFPSCAGLWHPRIKGICSCRHESSL
ncbi:hypothetical protein [Achromobacter animicus]|uniref:hypothetical protein n=1 Tax=Achromobacter animicus TaxID=1389935 RepID=UPI00345E87BD